ncbi:MAG: TetR/AcrR family transcriptional regulator [Polyangiaceae bacterium]
MARPPEPEKRAEIAREAVDVLARLGLGTPMTRLADELGVKRPTLHYHFPTRAHIVETALEELLTEQALFVMQRVNEHEHPIDRLFAQICAVHAFHHGREERIVFLSQAVAASGERMAEIIDVGNRVFEAQRRANVRLLQDGMATGAVAPCDAEALVNVIRALTDGLMVQRVMTHVDLGPVHEFLWTHLLRPLKRPSETQS